MTQTDHRPAGMDQRPADLRLYLHELFGGTDGYVRLLTMESGEAHDWEGLREGRGPFWQVPNRSDLLDGIADSLVDASARGIDAYCCPYAHERRSSPGGRHAGGATSRRHAHADIDGPVDLERARALGAWAVASGSTAADGTPHGHIYVRMTESVSEHAHTALCRGLGQMIGGEHHDTGKVHDNDVLRPPGTLNHKRPGDPRPVAWLIRPDDLTVRTWEPEALARELGVRWPVREPGEGLESDSRGATAEAMGPTGEEREALEPVPLAEGLAARRVDGLVRMVAEAERGAGNDALNRAAGVCAALCATAGEAEGLDPDGVRERLVQAYRDRPSDEPRRQREQTARRTVASGWRWGTDHPAEARADRGPRAAAEVAEEQTTMTTTEPEAEAAVLSNEPLTAEEEAGFWASRHLLRAVQGYARSRRIGRWALLGAVLARAAAEVPPSVVLPPTRGTAASLNLYVGLCSESGGGKSAAMGTAAEVLDVRGGAGPLETSLGSGEGLLAAYVHVQKEKGQAPRVVQHRASVLFDVDEVGSLGALAARTNSTLLPFLKSAWSGRLLATQNADADRLRRVEAHAYRLAVVAGVQPKHAGTILDDDGGGFPQRWLWMPTYDPAMPSRDEVVPEPVPYRWQVPGVPVQVADDGTVTVQRARPMILPAEAVAAILDAAEASNRPIGAPAAAGGAAAGAGALDGHALLSRAKVAALLALLEGRGQEVTAADWSLAGVVMRVSDHTRASIVRVRGAEASREADRRAVRQGRSSAIAATSEENVRVQAACKRIRALLEDGELSLGKVHGGVTRSQRELVADALARLIDQGEVTAEERIPPRQKKATTFYRVVT